MVTNILLVVLNVIVAVSAHAIIKELRKINEPPQKPQEAERIDIVLDDVTPAKK